ncbi:MAG: hypothetical protein PHU31_11590 [Anaerotignum sp.]|nr:hypothetical protein [Anaerotignum sp.]
MSIADSETIYIKGANENNLKNVTLHIPKKKILLFHSMVQQGNTMFLVEYNLDILKAADYVIELGPGGGAKGGHLLFSGTPHEMLSSKYSVTAPFLKQEISPGTLD